MTQLYPQDDEAPRDGQDPNEEYPDAMLHYSNGESGYIQSSGNSHYSVMPYPYPPYLPPYVLSQNRPATTMYMPTTAPMMVSYPHQTLPSVPLPSQPRSVPHYPLYSSPAIQNIPHRLPPSSQRMPPSPVVSLAGTEDQESLNNDSMRSEPICPPLDGFPSVDEFDELMRQYVQNLSPKKQDKALIHSKRANNIRAVLKDKKLTHVESAQFRFWVKKMFELRPVDPLSPTSEKRICHEGKPVAIREKLFKILTKAHKACQHGGRDKTSLQVRKVYSWVPKELISRFVKICPTCQLRRGPTRPSSALLDKGASTQSPIQSPMQCWRRGSSATTTTTTSSSSTSNSNMQSPIQMAGASDNFHRQSRWMEGYPEANHNNSNLVAIETATSNMVNMSMHGSLSPDGFSSEPPKLSNDPGTPYMRQRMSHRGSNPSPYHPYAYDSRQPMQQIQQADQRYQRAKRPSTYNVKHEHQY